MCHKAEMTSNCGTNIHLEINRNSLTINGNGRCQPSYNFNNNSSNGDWCDTSNFKRYADYMRGYLEGFLDGETNNFGEDFNPPRPSFGSLLGNARNLIMVLLLTSIFGNN